MTHFILRSDSLKIRVENILLVQVISSLWILMPVTGSPLIIKKNVAFFYQDDYMENFSDSGIYTKFV